MTGCASPGPPKAPSLNLPVAPAVFHAERIDQRVVLTWVSAANSTEGDRLRGSITAVVCRGMAASACNPIQRFAVQPGTDTAEERLPADLLTGPPRAVFYQVELLNESGRSAGASAPVYVAAGAAPPAVDQLNLIPRKDGALVRWQPSPPASSPGSIVQVTRTLVAATAGSAAAAVRTDRAKAIPRRAAPANTSATKPDKDRPLPVVLESSPADSAGASDPGGMVDAGVLDGGTYRYVAQRILRVKPAVGTLELHSEPSAPVEMTYRRIFPPVAPAGLVAIPGGGLDAAPSIDLSWEPSAEDAVIAYRVYRATFANGSFGGFERLTPAAEALAVAAFRDLTVSPGQRYAYRVTALDALGNESKPSAVIEETAPAAAKTQ